jgi:alpha-L-arabinofuranosidase
MSIARVSLNPLNTATPHSLQVDISKAGNDNTAQIINEGFWGINVIEGEKYLLNFYLRINNYAGTVTAMLQDENDSVLTSVVVPVKKGSSWQKYTATLSAKKSCKKSKFVLSFNKQGTVWLDFVSLFPAQTFKNRPNGLRKDLAQYIADLKPAFIRWPGGCFVEGINIQSAPDWKHTIGPVEKRPGTYSPWGYYTSDGFGYHEWLQYCEDIGAAGLYVFNAGVSCEYRSGTFVSEDSLQPYIQNALDAIEYAIGPVTSKWGKLRAAAGHPKPFPLKYAEIGNEQHGPQYAERYNIFYKAIKAKYPNIELMASMGIGDVNDNTLKKMERIDFVDEHAYKAAGWSMRNFDHFDKYKRGDWKMYVGEYATNAGVGSGNMEAALSDAVYIMAMEKNSDLVKMSSYAPLLVNTNDVDWPVNLINFDNASGFARISYYTIKMMNEHKATVNLETKVDVLQPKLKKPSFTGGIGLATWDTKTAYKDIEIISGGKTVYKSDFIHDLNDWSLLRGNWKLSDSAIAQTAEGAQQFAMLNNRSFETYTLKLKAKKLEGYNAFIIPFAVKDSNTFYRAHIGGWVNRMSVFEKVSNGYDVSNISSAINLTDTIVANRWYDIRLEVGADSVKCFLDDKLLMVYTEPVKVFSIAGKDDKSGDIIVKLVNGNETEVPVSVAIKNAELFDAEAEFISLSAPSLNDENSFDTPTKFFPVKSKIPASANGISFPAKAWSINIIRLKQKK